MSVRKLNILHITFDMAIGGTEQVIRQIIEGSRTECDHQVFCIDGTIGDIGKQLEERGIKISSYQRGPGLDKNLIKALRQFIINEEIDVVHCHQYTPYTYGAIASMFLKVPVMFTEHGRFFPDSYTWKRRLINPVLNIFTNRLVAISQSTKDALVKFEWFWSSSIQVIYNGLEPGNVDQVEVSELRQNLGLEGKKVFGTVARLDSIKNHDMMIKAFAKVEAKLPDLVLVIVGDGPEREKTEKLVKDMALEEKVILTGFQPMPSRYYGLIDVFLLPSLSEGTSMTLLEAMANGKPSIVTKVGGNPEIVEHGVTGLVCESGDVEGLADNMCSMIENKGMYENMCSASMDRFKRLFTLDNMVSSYLSLYRQAC